VKKESYIAAAPDQKVFVKFGAGSRGLQRLGEIGVAPKLLAHGEYEGQMYMVQEFLEGEPPDRAWLGYHAREAGKVFARYHEDACLRSLLQGISDAQTDPAHHLRREVESLLTRVEALSANKSFNGPMAEGLRLFIATSEMLTPIALVPTHDEPNTSNMLVHAGRLVILDWDEIGLRDPFHDLGPFLWWYLPEGRWEAFLRTTDIELTDDMRQKVLWYSARASLDIGLWHLEHGYGDDRGFLGDFLAAVNLQPNPRARGLT
jgi:aminoglycoside phosphotransferase (APT) family kinase protein